VQLVAKVAKCHEWYACGFVQAVYLTIFAPTVVQFHGSKVTSDAGLLPFWERDEALGLPRIDEFRFAELHFAKLTMATSHATFGRRR
jgi:hypothetical protein